jgi:hypothetical protein
VVGRRRRQWERSAKLHSAAAAIAGASAQLFSCEHVEPARARAALREALGEERFAAAWTAGGALSIDEACALALDDGPPAT